MASLLSGTTIGGYTAVHSNNISTYALTSLPSHTHDDRYIRFTGAELTEGNYYYFRSNRGSYLGGLDSATLQVYATGGNSAFMSFHRSGNYAVNFGLDADNVMRIGGWSAGADRWVLDMSGNNWVAGSFRAPIFYDSQDTFYYVDPNGRSRLSQLQTGGDISTNDSFGASLFSSFTADGKYLTRNWHHTDGGYTWPGMTYRTGLSDSAIGSTAMAGNGAWAGHRQRGWTPVDVTKTYKISVWIRTTSGNPYCYLSLTQATYDLSQPNNGGWGNPYFWAGVAPSSWTEYTMTIGPSGSGAGYNWNAGTKYVQLGLLHDYRYTGYAGQAEFTGFKIEELDDTLANNVTVMGNAVIHAGNIGSQSVNYASSAGSVAWTNVSSRPTALSQFTNDLGNYGGWLTTSGKAADSELVDGIDSSRIVFGDGARASSNSGDMNDPNQKSGFYFAYNPSGRPYEEYWNWITIAGNSWQSSNNYQFQLAHDFHSDRFYVRRMTNGSVASWREVITSGNIGSQSVNYAATAGSAPANGGNSSTVAGLSVHSGRNNEADKIVRTDSNGYIQAGWINTTSGARSSATRIDRIYASDDSYLRYYSLQDFKVALGLPRNSFNRHADYSTTEGYHTGIMGYGNSYDVFNSLPHFGSGFIDFWSGPSNAPDSDHWVGIQSFHAVNWNGVAGRNYGWQMVHKGGTTGDIRFNSQWSDNDYGWISIWNSANDGAGSGLDADLLDGQQGSYYINTSNIGSQSVNYAASAGSAGSATITEFQSIPDHRGSAYTPNAYAGNRVWWHFNNKDAVGGYGTYWHAIQTVSPWSSYDPSHRQQQIQWGGTDISFRYATSGTTWSSWFRFITDANIASQSVSYADESGYSASSGSVEWTSVQNKPATFAPSAHTHDDRYYTESESDGRYVPYGSITGSFGLNDNKLYLRTNGDNNHYLWNASDDWEELNAYEGTGFRITSNQGATGVLYVYGSSNGGYTYSPYSFRAPIFYDSADTNYYVDPNSTSMLYRVNSYYLSNPGDVADNHPYGIYFSSSLSTAYAIFREPGAWNHPYPDLRIAFHTGIKIGANAGYEGVRFYTDYDMSSQVMSVNNGSDPLGQGNVYVNNNLQAGSSLRAPIFYDSADTTYYGDFAGTSWLRHLSVGDVNASNDGGWNARLNLTGSSHARLDVKSNSDGIITTIYSHTGQGVGRVGTWSNHPLAFMVNGGIAGYAYANYLQGVDSVRAPIFYDSNDTGYYLDPNGTSNLLTVNVLNTYVGNAIYFGGGNNYFNWDGARINSNVGIQSTSDMRAPIFYDSNDTGYYGNFAGFSRMSEIGVTNQYVYNYDSIESGRTTAEFGSVGKYVATRNAVGDYPSFSFEHVYGTFAWGQIARFHIRASGQDRPSIQFSSGSSNDRWNIGFCTGVDNNFRISQNMGYRPDNSGVSDGWGTERFRINTDGSIYISSSLQAYSYQGHSNVAGTGNASYHPSGIYSTGTNWLYGTMYMNNNSIRDVQEIYNNGWFRTVGHQGLYNPTNDAHFYPNNATYGSWRISGSRNGWHGIHFDSGSTLMMNSAETGIHREGYGWQFRWYNGSMYVSRGTYGGGTEYTVIDSGTIGSQSVSYASSAGGVSWANVSSKPATWLNEPNLIQGSEPDTIRASGFYESYLGSGNPTGTWMNYINVRHSNTANGHGFQLGMSYYDNNLWFRSYSGNIPPSFQSWSRALGTNTDPYPSNMNQYVRTTDDVTHNSTTSPTFVVNNHSDNTKGYRIHNTSGSSVSAMFTNSSNQLVIAAGAFDQINLNKKVYVNGVALGVNVAPSATAGRIDASNDIVAYSSSDERLKYNITPIENAIDKVKSLTGVEFDWKPEYKHAHGYEGHDTGIIAQQVQEVIPSAVRTNDTGFLAVRYEKLIGLLVEGMKEQQAQIEELKAKLDGLTK